MIASNDAELIAMLSSAVGAALTDVGDEMKNEIKDTISASLGGGSVYQPNGAGSLSEAWKVESPSGVGSTNIETEMHYDSSLLSYDSNTYKHVSPTGEAISDMASLVFESGAGPLFGQGFWTAARPAGWDNFLSACSLEVGTWVKNGLIRAGLDVI